MAGLSPRLRGMVHRASMRCGSHCRAAGKAYPQRRNDERESKQYEEGEATGHVTGSSPYAIASQRYLQTCGSAALMSARPPKFRLGQRVAKRRLPFQLLELVRLSRHKRISEART